MLWKIEILCVQDKKIKISLCSKGWTGFLASPLWYMAFPKLGLPWLRPRATGWQHTISPSTA